MDTKTKTGAVVFGMGLCGLLLIPLAGLSPILAAISALAVVVGWWLYPGLWRTAGRGAICGAAAGLLVLGPGFRIAMRMVAIADPIRRPEFTPEGTLFIVIFVGAVFGAIVGTVGTVQATAFRLGLWSSGVLFAGLVMSLIALDPNLRSEILELGAGPWFNIPMFTGVAFAYGIVTTLLVRKMEVRRVRKMTTREKVELRA